MGGWIVFLVVAVPIVVVALFLLLDESIVKIEPGELGLLLVQGKATDKAIGPGRHWVPALRRHTVAAYPSRELSFRATPGLVASGDPELERTGPPTAVVLGDGAEGSAEYTIRFRLDPSLLKSVHERFGREGIWPAVRDLGGRAVAAAINEPGTSVDDVYGPGRPALSRRVTEHVTEALAADGFVVTVCELVAIDLGATGSAIQATVRARLELAREQAEAAMRRTRAEGDAEIARVLADVDAEPALRYRETDAWRDVQVEIARSQRLIATHQPAPQAAAPPLVRNVEVAAAGDDSGDEA